MLESTRRFESTLQHKKRRRCLPMPRQPARSQCFSSRTVEKAMFKAPGGWWFEEVILAIYWQASWSNKEIPMIIALENGVNCHIRLYLNPNSYCSMVSQNILKYHDLLQHVFYFIKIFKWLYIYMYIHMFTLGRWSNMRSSRVFFFGAKGP